jgi:heavy metal translocating P-type ATPase
MASPPGPGSPHRDSPSPTRSAIASKKDPTGKNQSGSVSATVAAHECCSPLSEHAHLFEPVDLIRIAFVALAAAAVWFRLWEPLPQISVLGVAATLIGGYPILEEAYENIAERRMTMELSMTIALLSALAIREFFTALVITLFVLVAEVLEGLTVGRGRRAIRDLLDFLPRTASLIASGQTGEVPMSDILPGDLVLVRPGSRVPVDGIVIGGHSFIDQSAITGESMPVEKFEGKEVYAGTINQSGALQVRVERLGRDTSFGKIIEAVEEAERSRAPIQKTADRLAGYLVYFALAAAALTFLLTHNMRSTISVVIVAGACGIAAGTPLAILGAIGRAAKHGSIIKGGLYLEKLATVDTVVLDKTGTLTYGAPEVVEIKPADGWPAQGVLKTAATAELRSEHPVGKAIVNRALSQSLRIDEPESFSYVLGRGVICSTHGAEIIVGSQSFFAELGLPVPTDGKNGSEVFVSQGGELVGSIVIADRLRPEAAAAVSSLEAMGIKTALLTGDNNIVAEEVAKALNVTSVFSELLPEQKLQYVKKLVEAGQTVAMVGDGINDAPALAQANVGVAMGSGTDVARESADIVLIGNDLTRLVETVRLARKCRSIIMQNFYGTLLVDTLGMGLAAWGLLNPLLAAFVHVASELTFILNSTRLLPSPLSSRSG